MRKERTYILLLLATLLMASPVAYCVTPQDELDKEIASFAERAIRQSSPDDLYLMKWEINENGDTIFTEELRPARVFARVPKQKGKEWRKYYKLVFNFNKVYPYALVGRKMMAQVDSTIAADATKRSERTRYINDVEKELFRLFEQDIRHMTVTQGLVLMRLIDRECGMSAFTIIKTYENGLAANFWQLVAKLFSQNLKTRYDPTKGEDAKIEELCKIWDSGQWDAFYYSIFMERPAKVVIQRETLETEVRKKNR